MADKLLEFLQEHQAALYSLGLVSVVLFVGTLLAVPALIARIPADYFAHAERPPSRWAGQRRMVRLALAIGRNLLGGVLLLAGLAMLVLPGQGLLTMLAGLLLLDFPHKYRFEKWLLSRRRIRPSVDWLRRRAGREPLQVAR